VYNFAEKLLGHLLLHCALFQDPAVLQAINAQQHEPQIAEATSSTAATTATLPASHSQVPVTAFTHCISNYSWSFYVSCFIVH